MPFQTPVKTRSQFPANKQAQAPARGHRSPGTRLETLDGVFFLESEQIFQKVLKKNPGGKKMFPV